LESKTAEFIAGRVKKIFGIELSAPEQAYICIHLVGYNAFTPEQDNAFLFPQKIEYLSMSLIELVDGKLSTRYSRDKMLFFDLCLHLKTSVYRLKVATYVPKGNRTMLSGNWSGIYDVLKASAAPVYEQICQVIPDEEEFLNIAYFFMLSQRRCSTPVGVLLVSNWGIMPRMALLDEIEHAFPMIRIVDSCSVQQLNDWPNRKQRFDLIISTEPLEQGPRPCIVLPPTAAKGDNYTGVIERSLSKMLPDLL
ncbi:MAG: hypothetical protein LBL15_08475, partial [Oscillospiraceae bacterium]|nr:hypothetical protein [Oscillospiraceae bacterium]